MWTCSTSKSMEHVHVHRACLCPCCMAVSILHARVRAVHGHGNGQEPWTWTVGHAAFTEPEDDILLIFWHSTYVYVRKQHISVKEGCYIVTLSAFPGKMNQYDTTGYISAAEVYSTCNFFDLNCTVASCFFRGMGIFAP